MGRLPDGEVTKAAFGELVDSLGAELDGMLDNEFDVLPAKELDTSACVGVTLEEKPENV